MCEKKENSVLKTVLIIIGAVVSIAAIAAAVCYLFKKYFKITFNTNECDECDCNGCFVENDDMDFAPECDYDGAPEVEGE